MKQEKKNPVTVKKVIGNYDKVLAAFGGMAGGKLLSHFLDQAITSPPVQGLVGVELSQNLSKYVKPVIVTGTGLTVFAVSKNQLLKYAGIGCAGIGVSDLVNTITGKDYLAGLNGAKGFGNTEDDYRIIPIETIQPPAPALNLPMLSGKGMGTESPSDDYIEPFKENEIVYVEDLDAA